MSFKSSIAIISARAVSLACRLAGKQGVTIAGRLALKIDPSILRNLSAQVRKKIFVVCGTNGKTTTNNLICSALEAEGAKVICNSTGSNMLIGVAAAFVLSASIGGRLDADYACIEIDEAFAQRVFPHFSPDYMVITNMFRDQLDRYGEIDTTIGFLQKAIAMDEKLTVIANADDPLVTWLAKSSGRDVVYFGITDRVFDREESNEIREGRFCKFCGTRLEYRFYHYGQMGSYRCPGCGFERPLPRYDAREISLEHGLDFDLTVRDGQMSGRMRVQEPEGCGCRTGKDAQEPEGRDRNSRKSAQKQEDRDRNSRKSMQEAEISTGNAGRSRHIHADYRGFYNIYNILAAYGALLAEGIEPVHFDRVLTDFHPRNGRNEPFEINGCRVLLNLAKNPAGFNQNIQSVMEDPAPKDIIIVINDHVEDGTDISWLWDVDFDRLGEDSVRSITVSGIRCHDMRLRLKYAGIPCGMVPEVKEAVKDRIANGCRNLYVLVNYSALYSTHVLLQSMAKERREPKKELMR